MTSIDARIAEELGVRLPQVTAAVALLDDKQTVPFIARYRKEATGGLDDVQLRTLEERLTYLRELEDRRAVVLKSVAEQGKLTPELEAALKDADTKARLEDLYAPYKPKRRTRGQIAREAGLEPLATLLLAEPTRVPEQEAAAFVDAEKGIADVAAALEGARWILVETFAEDPELVGSLRETLWERGEIVSTVIPGKEDAGAKFADYFKASESVKSIPSHRALALLRGRKEEVLRLTITLPEPEGHVGPTEPERRIAAKFGVQNAGRPADAWLLETVRWTWKFKLSVHLEADVEARVRELADGYRLAIHSRTDRMFAVLLVCQWLAMIVLAVWVTPLTWVGAESRPHPHVWAALLIGGRHRGRTWGGACCTTRGRGRQRGLLGDVLRPVGQVVGVFGVGDDRQFGDDRGDGLTRPWQEQPGEVPPGREVGGEEAGHGVVIDRHDHPPGPLGPDQDVRVGGALRENVPVADGDHVERVVGVLVVPRPDPGRDQLRDTLVEQEPDHRSPRRRFGGRGRGGVAVRPGRRLRRLHRLEPRPQRRHVHRFQAGVHVVERRLVPLPEVLDRGVVRPVELEHRPDLVVAQAREVEHHHLRPDPLVLVRGHDVVQADPVAPHPVLAAGLVQDRRERGVQLGVVLHRPPSVCP